MACLVSHDDDSDVYGLKEHSSILVSDWEQYMLSINIGLSSELRELT